MLLPFAVFGAEPARAQSVAPETEERRALAKKHYDRARDLVREEQFAEAAEEFRAAYESLPNFQVLYNLGQAHVALDQPVEALEVLSRYLSEGGDRILPARRAEVELQIARQRARTAELVVFVKPESAAVTLDDKSIPASALAEPIRVSAESHVLTASAPGYETKSEALTLVAEHRRTVAIRLQPISAPKPRAKEEPIAVAVPASAEAQVVTPTRTTAPEPSNSQRTLAYVLGGVGALVGGVALGIYLDNDARFNDWSARQQTLDAEWEETEGARVPAKLREDQEDNNERGRSIEARDRTCWILGIGAGAIFATGVVLYATSSPNQRRSELAMRIRADQAGLRWETRW